MDTVFQFHAEAAAASGTLSLPFQEQINVVAGSTLPPGGGYGSSRIQDFRHREILTIKEAYSYVTGSATATTVETAATAVVVGLNILDIVTADRIVARLTSSRPKGSTEELSIIPLGSTFENLRIAGRKVAGADQLATKLFTRLSTLSAIAKDPRSAKSLDKELDEHLSKAQRDDARYKAVREYLPRRGPQFDPDVSLSCSLAPELRGTIPEFDESVAHIVSVKSFGVVRLAEYRMRRNQRRLTMLALVLGSPFKGGLEVCYAASNGDIWG
jgi:hypothetical protein